MRHRSFLLGLAAVGACAPAVTHGPRVDRGVILTATAGAPRPLCTTGECVGGLVPTLGGGVRAGWVPSDASKPAFQLGATVPLMDPLGLELDSYVQAPTSSSWAYGAGVLTSARHVVPYVELGYMPPDRDGVFLSMARAWLFTDPEQPVGRKRENGETWKTSPPRYWAPGAGYRFVRGDDRMTVYANLALGSYVETARQFDDAHPDGYDVATRRPVRLLMFGTSFELAPPRRLYAPRVPPRPAPAPRPVPQPDPAGS